MNECIWCDEPVEPSEQDEHHRQPIHWECGLRSIVGGFNHIAGSCSCCGGNDPPDPEGLTRRQAAIAAARYWLMLNGRSTGVE